MMSRQAIGDDLRATFDGIADHLIPAYEQMPAASAVGVSGALLDRVLAVRPDLKEALVRGLQATAGLPGAEGAVHLYRNDREAFDAIAMAASGGYYMDERVRELIGYPGQEYIEPADPYAPQSYVGDGALERVFNRGPIYVPTPGEEAKSHPQLLKKR